jgi:hypothetical protein
MGEKWIKKMIEFAKKCLDFYGMNDDLLATRCPLPPVLPPGTMMALF